MRDEPKKIVIDISDPATHTTATNQQGWCNINPIEKRKMNCVQGFEQQQATVVCMFREIQQHQHLSWHWLHQFLAMNGADWCQTLPNVLRIQIWKNSKKKISSKKTLERRVMKMSVPRFALHLPRSSVFFSAGKLLDFVHEMDLATITRKFWDCFWGKIARWLESGLPLPSNSLHIGTLFCGTVITPCSGVLACVFSCHVRHRVAICTTCQNPLKKKTPLPPTLLSQSLKKYGSTTTVIKDQSQTNNGTCERDIRKDHV